jgi:serine/threonine protein kinase
MAEETRYYGTGQSPKARSSATVSGLAETEIAPTVASAPRLQSGRADASAPAGMAPSVPLELAPGAEVGEYRVGRKLGEGGMGAVYAGEQPAIGKRVAIKVLAPHYAQDVELVRRFLDEARAVNLIHHPNIIDIFSFGELPGPRPYFVMEYLDGESLADAIDREHLRPDEIRRLLRQICGALAATHRMGIVHRDLKPENIWIARPPCGESYVKLLDFGIAKLLDPTRTNLTQTGAVMGTPLFMSPEQCLGREVGAGADIYAMGVLLYRIFTGRYPFMGTVTTELAIKHVSEAPPPPSSFRPLPAGLEVLILDCLAKDPAARPATAELLGSRLEDALSAWPEHRMAAPRGEEGEAESGASVRFPLLSQSAERTMPVAAKRRAQHTWPWFLAVLVVAGGVVGAWLLLRAPEAAPVAPLPEVARPAAGAKTPAAVAVPETVSPAQPPPALPEKKSATAREPSSSHGARRASIRPRLEPAAPLPAAAIERAAEAKPEPDEAKPASQPLPAEAPPPPPRPTRAQERGLVDENPLRR